MKAANHVEVIELAKEGDSLLLHARELMQSVGSEGFEQLGARIPESIEGDNGPLKVVFAGQYSAGKSSVISALTGRDDIPIGAGITTQHTTAYHWQGVDIIDTPGVHTTLRPDHDEISYRAIAEADLVVFATTNELFDDHLAAHFRKLAIDRDKGHEMLLLINKMCRHAQGNTPEAHEIVTRGVRGSVNPLTPEELRISFVDAESALEARSIQDDPEEAAFLWEESGIDVFAATLNGFIQDKGLAGRFTTALYSLEQVLQEALTKIPSGDPEIDGVEELLVQTHNALLEERQQVVQAIRQKVEQATEKVRAEGRRVAGMMHGEADQKAINKAFVDAEKEIDGLPDVLTKSLEAVLSERSEKLQKRIDGIMNSELGKELLPRLSKRVEEQLAKTKMSPESAARITKGAEMSERFGRFLVANSFSPATPSLGAIFKLKSYAGTETHKVVLKVGKFLGKSFKPWEAVKWTKYIANAGRVMAVAGVVVTFIMAWREDVQEAQQEKDLGEARAATRHGFSEAAEAIETYFDEVTNTYIAESLEPEIERVNQRLAELRAIQAKQSEQYQALVVLLDKTQALIRRIHQAQDSGQAATA